MWRLVGWRQALEQGNSLQGPKIGRIGGCPALLLLRDQVVATSFTTMINFITSWS